MAKGGLPRQALVRSCWYRLEKKPVSRHKRDRMDSILLSFRTVGRA